MKAGPHLASSSSAGARFKVSYPCAASATGQLTSAQVGMPVYTCRSQAGSVDRSLSSLVCPKEVIFVLLSLPSSLEAFLCRPVLN